MLQTVGVKMWARWIKLKKFKRLEYISYPKDKLKLSKKDKINYNKSIFIDYTTMTWLKTKEMKGGRLTQIEDDIDHLIIFKSLLGDDFDKVIEWEGVLPILEDDSISNMQNNRNMETGWVVNSWNFYNQYRLAIIQAINLWEGINIYDNNSLDDAISKVHRYQLLLNNDDLDEYFILDGWGGDATIPWSINHIKELLINLIKVWKIKWVNPYNGSITYLNNIPHNIPKAEYDRRRLLLNMLDHYNEYSEYLEDGALY